MFSILAAFGTRAEAIKIAPLIRALRKRAGRLSLRVVVTGEHRETVAKVLRLFEIEADDDLDLGGQANDRADFLGLAVSRLSTILSREQPNLVMVLGDTATTLAATLAAYYHRIPVAHVEAGLRTGGKFSTYPEEGHRQLITPIADLHFAPTEVARLHLLDEGVDPTQIFVTGNTGIDALQWVRQHVEAMRADRTLRLSELFGKNGFGKVPVRAIKAVRWAERGEARLVLITGSRPEIFHHGLQSICGALSRLADLYPDVVFFYPADLQPRMREAVQGLLHDHENVFVLPALDYAPFVYLMTKCHFVLTDSGSIQEEAPGLGKPVLVMRRTTDRPEALEAGAVQLVGTDAVTIVASSKRLLDDDVRYKRMTEATNVYGDGLASERIADVLENYAYGTLDGPATQNAS